MKFTFEDNILDCDRRELMRGGERIALGPQVLDLLVHLLRERERVVSKTDLIEAIWGGRAISDSTLTSHINAARKAVADSGEKQRLIRTVPRKGYRFVGNVMEIGPREGKGASEADDAREVPLAVPDRPSIAVLPFLNLSGDPTQDYFVDGVVEDVISALSRVSGLFVIARNSTFTYKGRAVDVKQTGRELGVRYILEGSLRKAATRVRVTGQLVDATAGTTIWSERFDGDIDDIFDLQNQLAARVVGAIVPQIERAEIKRAQHKPTDSLDAYDYYLRGLANFHKGTRQEIDAALELFLKAAELDRDYAPAYGMAAWCMFWRKLNGWSPDFRLELDEATRLARLAIVLGNNDPIALTRGGHALAHFGGDADASIELLDRALLLNPNLSAAWYLSGFQRIERGEPDAAIERFMRAMRLSPLDPEMVRMEAGMALAHLFAGRFDDASLWAGKAFRRLPSFVLVVAIVAASHALAGRPDKARRAMEHLRTLHPALRISQVKDWILLRRQEDIITFTEGLRLAGLPA